MNKKIILLAAFAPLAAAGFAQGYYAEYSFAEAEEFDAIIREMYKYEIFYHWTKADIQKMIAEDIKDYEPGHRRRILGDYMNKMLKAGAGKRIFFIDLSVRFGPYGWLFIKLNENEYAVFFTGT